jgi:hypothetical protein
VQQQDFSGWESVDFAFIPVGELEALRPPRLDLALDILAFEEMSGGQAGECVAHAWDLGCPYLYSLHRDRRVRETIARHYWPREVRLLDVPHTRFPDDPPTGRLRRARRWAHSSLADAATDDYRHVIGWRRANS